MNANPSLRRTSLAPGGEISTSAVRSTDELRSGPPSNAGEIAQEFRRRGVRHEVTERVRLESADGEVYFGWALNVSRGGVRVILEQVVARGDEYDVTVGESDPQLNMRGRVVWVQVERDGAVAGVEFVGSRSRRRRAVAPRAIDHAGGATFSVDGDGLATEPR